MNRREFIQSLAALTALQAIPLAARAASIPKWSSGFEGVNGDLAPVELTVTGNIPKACQGTLYRNGPALYQRGDQRYGHWFDPDGMIQAYNINNRGVSHRGRFVRTRKFEQEAKAGRFLFNGAGTVFPGSLAGGSNEDNNVANINIQPHNGELLALWEAGSPYRIDPLTLETRGQLVWNEDLNGVPFSAHPHVDETGDMWNIGSVAFIEQPLLVLYHLGKDGSLRKSRAHTLDFAGYMHDFVLTPRYLLALNSSAVMCDGPTYVDSIGWEPDRPSQLLVFDRNDFSLVTTIEVPATFVFHFGNAWEDGPLLHFTAAAYASNDLVTVGMRELAQQQAMSQTHTPELVRYTVSVTDKRASIHRLGIDMEFPSFNKQTPFSAQPLLGAGGQRTSKASLASHVLRVDPRSGEAQTYSYGEGTIVEEPLFVDGPNGGYVVHSFLNYALDQSGIAILAAEHVADGPIAMAHMERVMPLGFHGCFLAGTA
ncbi:MAG: carotenoid oxygenase family protein [Congregibacter sp.]